MIGTIVYYSFSERVYFSLFSEVYIILIGQHVRELGISVYFFHFYFLNNDISITIYAIEMNFSVCISNVLPEGSVSQIFYLGPSYYFMSKIG